MDEYLVHTLSNYAARRQTLGCHENEFPSSLGLATDCVLGPAPTACLRNIPAGIVNILMWIVIYIGLTVGIYIIAGIVIGVFALLFGETAPSFAGAGIVAFGTIAFIVMTLSALILAVLVIINIYTAYRNLLTDAPLEN